MPSSTRLEDPSHYADFLMSASAYTECHVHVNFQCLEDPGVLASSLITIPKLTFSGDGPHLDVPKLTSLIDNSHFSIPHPTWSCARTHVDHDVESFNLDLRPVICDFTLKSSDFVPLDVLNCRKI